MGGGGFPPEMHPRCPDVYMPLYDKSFSGRRLQGTSPRIKCEWFERIYSLLRPPGPLDLERETRGSPSPIGSGIPVRGTRLHGRAGVFGLVWAVVGEKLEHGKLQCPRSVQTRNLVNTRP
jgi:hypothetical protein